MAAAGGDKTQGSLGAGKNYLVTFLAPVVVLVVVVVMVQGQHAYVRRMRLFEP